MNRCPAPSRRAVAAAAPLASALLWLACSTASAQPAAEPPPAPLATGSLAAPAAPTVVNASVAADSNAAMPAATPAPQQAAVDTCASVSDRAMASDLRSATAQSQKEDSAKLARLVDESIALWTLAVQRCEGRGQERARRNLADSERSRQNLSAQLGASPACNAGQKDAGSLQEMALQAVRERRWVDAAMLYRKAENMWDVTAERCAGDAQQTALQRRDQTATDAHNAEHCAPVFERARDQSAQLRRLSAGLTPAEKLTHSQAAETLWREATEQCRGPALDMARNSAQSLARDRGTPWVATPVPGAPAAVARTPAPTPAAPAPALTAAPAAALVASAATGSAAAASGGASAPGLFQSLSNALAAPVAAVSAVVAPAASASGPQDMDLQAGDTRFTGRFARDGDALTGNGQVRWTSGDTFNGDIVKGQRHGQGSFVWASGQRYSGSWVNDQPQGQGQMGFANGDQYEGAVAQGLPHGQGRMRYASGDAFEGQFNRGKPDGQGQYRWANGQSYEGPWLNEQPHGHGKLTFANGNVYEGQLQHGKPEGSGSLTFASGDRYEGSVAQGLPNGEGRYRWTNGDQYVGQWQQGRKHGKGRMEWSNGDRWEGRFDNDGQSAEGTLTRKGG